MGLDTGSDAQRVEPRYAPIAPSKYILLHFATAGLYSVVWFYRCWRYVRRRDKSSVWPWARALFNPITAFLLIADLRKSEGRDLFDGLAVAYFFFNLLWRLPDPYWLIAYFGFVPLLPVIGTINDVNRSKGAELPPQARWRIRNIPILLAGSLVVAFAVAATVGLIPSSKVLQGDEISDSYALTLQELGVVEEADELLFFYTDELFSIRSQGVVLTDRGVHIYWTDTFTDELEITEATYAAIQEIDTEWSTYWLDNTIVRLYMRSGNRLLFEISAEAGRDSAFVDELRRRHAKARSVIRLPLEKS
jgi:hypothetical protein